MVLNPLFDNVILTDVDGVLVNWEHSFSLWMLQNGYGKPRLGEYEMDKTYSIPKEHADMLMNTFNESAALNSIPPLRDAIKYVRRLHEDHGYVFHCITAIPNIPASYEARLANLRKLFGQTAIEKLILCGSSANKKPLLAEYSESECYWIEDLPRNAEYGLEYDLKPILINQHYNKNYINSKIPKVTYWREIYNIITDQVAVV